MRKIIEVCLLPSIKDAVGGGLRKEIQGQGFAATKVQFIQLYELTGDLSNQLLHTLGSQLLIDQVTQRFSIGRSTAPKGSWIVEVWFKPGVTDVVGESLLKAANDMGVSSMERGSTGSKYVFQGRLDFAQVKRIANEYLFNSLIQQVKIIRG